MRKIDLKAVILLALFLLLAGYGTAGATVQCVKYGPVLRGPDFQTVCRTLWAGQNMNAGTVCVTTNGSNLVITYSTQNGWALTKADLYVGLNVPTKSAPGQLGYSSGTVGATTTYVFEISSDEILGTAPFDCSDEGGDGQLEIYFAAHADLVNGGQQETGWAEGERFGGGWAMYFSATLDCLCIEWP